MYIGGSDCGLPCLLTLGACFVCVCMCLSVTTKSTAYLVCTSKTRYHRDRSLRHFQGFLSCGFAENALFKVVVSFAVAAPGVFLGILEIGQLSHKTRHITSNGKP